MVYLAGYLLGAVLTVNALGWMPWWLTKLAMLTALLVVAVGVVRSRQR